MPVQGIFGGKNSTPSLLVERDPAGSFCREKTVHDFSRHIPGHALLGIVMHTDPGSGVDLDDGPSCCLQRLEVELYQKGDKGSFPLSFYGLETEKLQTFQGLQIGKKPVTKEIINVPHFFIML